MSLGRMSSSIAVTYTIEIVNGIVQRKVSPYIQEFETFAKGRWIGRNLLEVLKKEFGAHPPVYWQNSIRSGSVKVNGSNVDESYVLKNGDKFLHRTHRHEPPVFGMITLVGETEKLLAVCKPSSVPMHPCGAYRFNSLECILQREPLVVNQPTLHVVHRLDKVTSGLVVLAKDKSTASVISEEIRQKTTHKVYLARVKGKFPLEDRLSLLRKLEKNTISCRSFENEGSEECLVGNVTNRKRSHNDISKNEISKLPIEELVLFPDIGIVVEEGDEVIVDSHPFSAVDTDVCASQMVQKLWVHCPIGVLSHRDGIHVCHPNGKSSLSQFSLVGYDKLTDTSLIVCVPLTGRTHQLRLHLELIGNPIANDPCYGGELFYGDEERRRIAYEHASTLESIGHIAQSRIPHLNTSRCLSEEQKHKNAASVEQRRNDDETDDEYLIRTCRFCQNDATTTQMEHSLHCDGIWLHALQYSGNGWQFRAPLPDWASPFNSESIEQIIQSL